MNTVVQPAIAWKNALNMSSKQKSMQLVTERSEPVVQYSKVLPGKLYFRRLGRIYMCDDNDLNRKALEVQGFRILPYQVGGVVGNAIQNAKYSALNFSFKVGDCVKADRPYGLPGKIGIITSIDLAGDLMVDYDKGGVMRVPSAYAIGVNTES